MAPGEDGSPRLRSPIPAAGRVLGVDLGSRRVGVAVSDAGQRIAVGSATLERWGDVAQGAATLGRLVVEYEAVGVVVGLPRSMSGRLGPAARAALAESGDLAAALGVAVETVDERLSTVTASADLRAGGRSARRQRSVIDQTAAAVLLQLWLDRRARQPGGIGTDG